MTNRNDLGAGTIKRIKILFPEDQVERVKDYLSRHCGSNLPMVDPSSTGLIERIRYAALKFSEGNFQELKKAVEQAAIDWRDTLMMAGFSRDSGIHFNWLPQKKNHVEQFSQLISRAELDKKI